MSTVVLLLSDKRSGSTMLQQELCRHQDISHVEYSPHSHFETHHWLKGAVMLGMPEEEFAGGKRYPGYGSAANARTYLVDCIKGNVPEYQATLGGKELVFDAWEALCNKYARPVFFEKSPQHLANRASLSLFFEWATQTEHTVRVIGLSRNPMSVMYSAFHLFHTPPEERQFGWLEIQKNLAAVQQRLPSTEFLHCYYEDIVSNPREAFAKIEDFIGVTHDPRVGSGAHAASKEKWRHDESYIFELSQEVADFAARMGYATEDLRNPHAEVGKKMPRSKRGQATLMRKKISDRIVKPLLLALKHRD